MNKYLVFFLLYFFLCLPNSSFSMDTVRFGVNEFPPYVSMKLPYNGFFCRVIKEVFESKGINVEFVFIPWKRALIEVENGILEGTPGWYSTPDRELNYFVSDPLIEDTQTFFHLRTYQFDWKNVDDLQGIRVGTTIGYDYGEEFARAVEQGIITVDQVSTDEQNFKKLLLGRIDVFPMNTLPGYSMINEVFSPDIVAQITDHHLPLRSSTLHILFSKNVEGERLLSIFNKGMKRFRESGKYDDYLDEVQL